MDVGLLVMRLVVGAFLVGHGGQELLGWFGGHGIAGTGTAFEAIARPERAMAATAAGA